MATELSQLFWKNFTRIKEARDLTFKEIAENTSYSTSNLTTSASIESPIQLDKAFDIAGGVGENLVVLLGAKPIDEKLIYPKNEAEAVENFWNNIDLIEQGETSKDKRKKVLKATSSGWRKDFVEGTARVTLFWLEKVSKAYSWEAYELICKKVDETK